MTDQLLQQLINQNLLILEHLEQTAATNHDTVIAMFLVFGALFAAIVIPALWIRMWRHG